MLRTNQACVLETLTNIIPSARVEIVQFARVVADSPPVRRRPRTACVRDCARVA